MSSDAKTSSDANEPRSHSDRTSQSEEKAPRGRGGSKRRPRGGRNARQDRTDAYRLNKSVVSDEQRRSAIAERFGVPHTSIDYPPFVSLKVKGRGMAVSTPQLKLPIVTGKFGHLLQASVEYIRAARVEITDAEYEIMQIVSSFQISIKLHSALKVSHMPIPSIDLNFSMVYNNVADVCNDNLSSVTKFINAIGYFCENSCTYVPVVAFSDVSHPERHSAIELPDERLFAQLDDLLRTQYTFDLAVMLSRLSDEDYVQFWVRMYPNKDSIPFQALVPSLTPEGHFIRKTINIVEMIPAYKEIMNKIHRKLPNAIETMEMKSGVGSAIQLIGCQKGNFGSLDAYALEKFDTADFSLGALFGFGSHTIDVPSKFHDPDICPYRCQVTDTGWAQDLARAMASSKT